MKIPGSLKALIGFSKDLVQACEISRRARLERGASANAYYLHGSDDPANAALYNRVSVHIDRVSSFLFSPGELRLSIEFDVSEEEPWLSRAAVASSYLSREYHRRDVDIVFSQAVTQSLIKGSCFVKHLWGPQGLEAWLVEPEFFGVLREDVDQLDRQEAFCHTLFLSMGELHQLLEGHPDRDKIEKRARSKAQLKKDEEPNWLHRVVIGGLNPVSTTTSSGTIGHSSVLGQLGADLSPQVAPELVRLDELWVMDDEREDYTTIQLVDSDQVIEGRYRHRNLFGVPGEHGFVKVSPNLMPHYFWGQSEVSKVLLLQDMLSSRVKDIKRIIDLQAKPPKAFIGFSGMTAEKYRALLARGGFIQESMPNAKIEDLSPKLPDHAFQEIGDISAMFDEQGGFKPIMMGEGEQGVRAGTHAKTLLRTASPKLRERALIIERQAEDSASIVFKLLQAKEARVFHSQAKEFFLLSQMPEDYRISVDSHSSSAAFTEDAKELAFALSARGAVGPEELILLTHPPMEDILIAAARSRAEAQQKLIAEHPELLAGHKSKK